MREGGSAPRRQKRTPAGAGHDAPKGEQSPLQISEGLVARPDALDWYRATFCKDHDHDDDDGELRCLLATLARVKGARS